MKGTDTQEKKLLCKNFEKQFKAVKIFHYF